MKKLFSIIGISLLVACASSSKISDQVKETVKPELEAVDEVVTTTLPELMAAEIPGTQIKIEMGLVPGGKFLMGSPETEEGRNEDEGPQIEVQVDSFWMGIYEIRFEEYNIFRDKDLDLPASIVSNWDADAIVRPSPPYEDPTFGMGKDGFPATSMTQFAALQYCKWLSEKTGDFYRLPSEAEWEYACRAGATTKYYFGDNSAELDNHSWNYDNSTEKYHKVGEKLSNAYGLFDMLGNVSEWTLDQYQKDAYSVIAAEMAGTVNPWIKPTKLHPRTVRGGSWDDDKSKVRCACRIRSSSKWKERDPQIPKSFWWNTDSPFVGFRIIKPVNQPSQQERDDFWYSVLGD